MRYKSEVRGNYAHGLPWALLACQDVHLGPEVKRNGFTVVREAKTERAATRTIFFIERRLPSVLHFGTSAPAAHIFSNSPI